MFKHGKKDVQKTLFDQDQSFPGYVMDMLQKSWAYDFYRFIFSQINEERFSVLYSDKASRPNKPVNVLVGLLILKMEHALSDEELIGSLYFDYRYQYALGLDANDNDDRLCVNTLSNFRARLVEYELQTGESLFQQEMEDLAENMAVYLGLNKSKARMDSSLINSSCKNMTRIELIYTVIRNMVREITNKTDWEIPESYLAYLEKGHQNKTIYQTKTTEEKSKLEHLIQQAHDLYMLVKDCAGVENFRSFEHLTRLLKEQAVATKDGNVKPVEGGKLTSQILQNPSDPDATFRHKTGESHIGHSLNFVEVYDNETDMG